MFISLLEAKGTMICFSIFTYETAHVKYSSHVYFRADFSNACSVNLSIYLLKK